MTSNFRLWLVYFAAAAGLAVTIVCLARDSVNLLGVLNPVCFLSYSPYLGIGYLTYFKRSTLGKSQIWLFGIVVIIAYAIYALIYNQLNSDAQGPLLYLFLPIYQWIAIAFVFAIDFVVRKKIQKNHSEKY